MQAARGASLSPGDDHGPTPRSQVRLFVVVATVWLVIDQATKVLAVQKLQGRASVELIPGLLSLSFFRNPGAALGFGGAMTIVLTLVAIVVCVAVIHISSRLRDPWWAVGLGLLLAGALGNLMDRLLREPGFLRGHVVDFIDYGVFVGNVADIALTFAAVIIIWRTWRGVGFDGIGEVRR